MFRLRLGLDLEIKDQVSEVGKTGLSLSLSLTWSQEWEKLEFLMMIMVLKQQLLPLLPIFYLSTLYER
jgi:hypothetical protein